MKESDILYEQGPFWICAATKFRGFEVWRNGSTHAIRVASIGYTGEIGLLKAKLEINRRLMEMIK